MPPQQQHVASLLAWIHRTFGAASIPIQWEWRIGADFASVFGHATRFSPLPWFKNREMYENTVGTIFS